MQDLKKRLRDKRKKSGSSLEVGLQSYTNSVVIEVGLQSYTQSERRVEGPEAWCRAQSQPDPRSRQQDAGLQSGETAMAVALGHLGPGCAEE